MAAIQVPLPTVLTGWEQPNNYLRICRSVQLYGRLIGKPLSWRSQLTRHDTRGHTRVRELAAGNMSVRADAKKPLGTFRAPTHCGRDKSELAAASTAPPVIRVYAFIARQESSAAMLYAS